MDSMNFRVQIFDPDGKFLRVFGKLGDSFGQFARPKGIGVDSEGHVYVVDSAFNNVQIFDETGRLLLFLVGLGTRGASSGFLRVSSSTAWTESTWPTSTITG